MNIDETDKILYSHFLKGDLSAFDELMRKYRKSVFFFINGYVINIFVYTIGKRSCDICTFCRIE